MPALKLVLRLLFGFFPKYPHISQERYEMRQHFLMALCGIAIALATLCATGYEFIIVQDEYRARWILAYGLGALFLSCWVLMPDVRVKQPAKNKSQ